MVGVLRAGGDCDGLRTRWGCGRAAVRLLCGRRVLAQQLPCRIGLRWGGLCCAWRWCSVVDAAERRAISRARGGGQCSHGGGVWCTCRWVGLGVEARLCFRREVEGGVHGLRACGCGDVRASVGACAGCVRVAARMLTWVSWSTNDARQM